MLRSTSVQEEEISFYVSRNRRTKERKEYSPKALQLVAPRNCSLAIIAMSLDTYNRRHPRKRTINKNRMFHIQSIEYYKLYPPHLLKFPMRMILHESSMTQVSTIQEGAYTRILAATEKLVFSSDLDKKILFYSFIFS